MTAALRKALLRIGAELERKEDLWQNDEILYHMSSDVGKFQISSDNYGCVFILVPGNQPAIKTLGAALSASGLFEREEVDFGTYT